jgi:SAM-dependent methyltransferase
MNFTGERVIPGEVDADLFNEHWARYLFAQQFAAGRNVLDAACGSGYGSALLSGAAAHVVGVDIALDAVEYAQRHCRSQKAAFAQADCLALPFAAGQFDLVVAFEIIEHLRDADGFLRELQRVLKPAGLLLISTPNRLYYTEDRGAVNPFHAREFSYPEFAELMGRMFPHYSILLQDHVGGLLLSDPSNHSAKRVSCDQPPGSRVGSPMGSPTVERRQREAYYLVAAASAQPLPAIQPLLYLPSTGNVLREREIHIHRLDQQLAEAQRERDVARQHLQEREEQLEERSRWAQQLDQTLNDKNAYLLQLQTDYEEKVKWALSLQQEIEATRAALAKLQQEFEERTAWALQLDADAQRLDAELKLRAEDLRMLFGSRWYRIGKNLRLSPVPPSDQQPKKD